MRVELKDVIAKNFDERRNEMIYESSTLKAVNNALIKRAHLKSLIYEMYELNDECDTMNNVKDANEGKVLIEGIMEKLPPGMCEKC